MSKKYSRRQFLKAGGAGGLSLALAPLLGETLRATPAKPTLPERVLAAASAAAYAPFEALPSAMPLGQPLADISMGWDGSVWGLDSDGVPHHYDQLAQSWQIYASGVDAIALDLHTQFILINGAEVYVPGSGVPTQSLASAWSGLPDSFAAGLDGAATVDTTLYLFRHGRYLRVDLANGTVVGAPVELSNLTNWPTAPGWQAGTLDAVGSHPSDPKQPLITLWANGEYLTVDIADARVVSGPQSYSAIAGGEMLTILQQGFSAVQYALADPETGEHSELRVFQGPVMWTQFDITGAALPSYLAEVESPWAPRLAHAPSGRTGRLWAATTDLLLPTVHDGASWRTVLPDEETVNYATTAVAAGADGAVFALANAVLYRLADDASTWTRVATAPTNAVQLAASDAANVWVRTTQNTVARLDGTSFSPVALGHPATHIAATADGTLWHAAGSAAAYRFLTAGSAPSSAVAIGSGITAVSHVAATGFGTAFVLGTPAAQAPGATPGPQFYRYDSPFAFKTNAPYTPALDFDTVINFQAATQTLVVGNHAVFVVSTARFDDPDQSSRVVALDVQTGDELWPAPFKLASAEGPANLTYDATRNLLYVAGGHTLYALDADAGMEVWALDLATPVPSAMRCGLVTLASGRLTVTVDVGLTNAATVLLDPADALARARQGQPVVALWTKPLPTTTALSTGVPLVDSDGTVYVPYLFLKTAQETAAVAAFDATGQLLWNRELGPISATLLSPVLDAVLVPSTASTPTAALLVNTGSAVKALNLANGGVMRTFDLPNATNAMVSSGLRLLGDRLYLGDTQGTLYVLDTATLKIVAQTKDARQESWQGVLGRPALIRSDAAADGLVVAFTRGDAKVWLFDPAGGTLAQIATDQSSVAALAYDDTHGLLYACSWDSQGAYDSLGQFFALRPDRTIQDERAFIIQSQLVQDYASDDEAATAVNGSGGVARYQTHVTIVDTNKAPRANQAVKLWADEDGTPVSIDGTAFTIGPQTPALFSTDGTGSFAITSDATDLQTVTLSLWAAFMDVHERIAIVPDAEFHGRLATTSATGSDDPQQIDTLSAVSYDNKPLFAANEQQQAVDAATATTQLAGAVGLGGGTISPAAVPDTPAAKYTAYATLPGMAYTPVSATPAQSLVIGAPLGFSLDSNGHTPLTPAVAADLIDSLDGAAPDGALLGGAFNSLRSAWKEIKRTAAKVTHVVVSVGSEVYAGIRYIVNDVVKVVKAVIRNSIDALVAIGSFFVQLGKLLINVVEAYSLLLHIDQVFFTAQKIGEVFNDMFTSMVPVLTDGKQKLDTLFQSADDWINSEFCTLIGTLDLPTPKECGSGSRAGSGTPVSGFQGMGATPTTIYTVAPAGGGAPTSHAVQCSWSAHTLRQNVGQATDLDGVAQAVGDPFAALQNLVSTFAQNVASDPALSAALQDVERTLKATFKPTSVDEFFEMALEDLLEMGRLALIAGVTLMKATVDTVLADVQTVVDGLQSMGGIKIPVLSALWHAVTGKPLTILDLVAFVVAFPVTVIYRAVEGKWPRNDTALQAAGGGSLLMHRIKNLAGGSAQLIGGILTAIFDLMAGEEDEKRLTIKGKPLVGLRVVGVLGLLGSITVLIDTAVVSKSDWLKAALSSTVATIVFAVLSPLHEVLTFISIVCQMGAMVEYGEVYHIFEGQPVYDRKQLKLTLSRQIIGAAPTLVNWTKYTPEPADLIAPGADILCRWAAAGIQFTQAIETWNTAPIVAAPTPTPLPSPSPSPSPSPTPLPESLRRFLPWIRR